MPITISGPVGITDVNGTAAAPAITGTDTDSGMFFGTNTVALGTNGTSAVSVDSSQNATFNSTGALTLPVGTTTQRPTAVAGQLRYNSTTGYPEYYTVP